MDKEQYIDLQSRFTQINLGVGFLLFLIMMERYFDRGRFFATSYFVIMLGILLFERVISKVKFFGNMNYIRGYRYMQLILITLTILFSGDIYFVAGSYIIYMLLLVEFISNFDSSDGLMLVIAVFCAVLPMLVIQVYYALTTSYIRSGLMPNFLTFSVSTAVILSLWREHVKQTDKLQRQYYAKCRFIEDAYAVNQQLIENQEKVKRANEQLAYKKLQLESANKKINNVNSEINLQNKILNLISSQHDTERLLSMIAEVIRTNMGTEIVAIILYPHAVKGYELSCNINTSYGLEYKQFLKESVKKGLFQEMINENETYIDNVVVSGKYKFIKQSEIGSFLIRQIVRNDEIIGGLYIADSKYDMFVDTIPFYDAAVSSILIALDNANLYAKLEDMAIKDELTGIFNRRYLKEICDRYIFEALRDKTPLSVALFDIDKFKRVNDSYGHLFGDEALKMVANMAHVIATTYHGVAGRFGGEEFVVVFPNKSLGEAYSIVELMLKKVKETHLYHSGETVQIRLSAGVSSFPETCTEPNDLLNRADLAMYYSKENGRDRITIDSDEIREQVRLK